MILLTDLINSIEQLQEKRLLNKSNYWLYFAKMNANNVEDLV